MVYAAIASRNEAEAERVMTEHVASARDRLIQGLKSKEGEAENR